MKITICGSMQHIDAMKRAANELGTLGYEVEIPNPREGEIAYNILSDSERSKLKSGLIREHYEKISESDAIFVFNEDKKGVEDYIGGNSLMEMAFAFAQNIEIFLLKQPAEISYLDEILGMSPIVLSDGPSSIHEYFSRFQKHMSAAKAPLSYGP